MGTVIEFETEQKKFEVKIVSNSFLKDLKCEFKLLGPEICKLHL